MKTLYYGGPILTMADERDAPEALLAEDGVIRALGAYDDFAALPGVEKVNLKGRCLMPSFIDCHSHIVMSGQYATLANLEKCATFEEIAQTLKGYMDKRGVAPGQAVVGFGYDQNFLLEQRHPDKTLLDSVSAENPIIIMHVSGHLACANSKVLALAGITAETPDPEGGVIGRMPGTREPSGYLEEAALMGLQPMLYGLMGIDPAEVIAVMQRDYIQNGITTAQDGATSPQILSLLKAAGAMHALAIDVVAYPVINACPGDVLSGNPPIDGRYANRLKLGGYKLVLDGSPQGRSAWMSKPYLGGEADYRGYPYLQDDAVNALVERAVREHKQILVHCNGDAASEQFINAYEHALAATASAEDLRPMMIHCQTVRDDQLDRMAVLNMIASIFVGHVYYWGDVHIKNFGPERGNRVSPVRSALRCGVSFNFHQDTPVTRPDMLHSVWCAVNRVSRSGKPIGPEQAVPVYEALRAVTANAAYAYFEEDRKGTLEAGKLADMVILDRSPLAVDPMELRDIRVMETIKEGKTLYRRAEG